MFEWGTKTYVMGIVNATPDSFSGDGLMVDRDVVSHAVAQATQFVADGVDILDIGGQSTRPGSQLIDADEELKRVVPVIKAIRAETAVPISVDTFWAKVATAAIEAGADIVNDVWALRMDADMARVVADAGCPVVLMHNRSKAKDIAQQERLGGRYLGAKYDDLITDIKQELMESVSIALDAGVKQSKIILDPGAGFGKSIRQNMRLVDELDQFKSLGFPILLGTSRKSFIGYTLDLPPEERMEGTAVTVALGIDRGADIVRVHDVKSIVRVARMTDAIVRV
ncbi:MAG: dihydropteroate synthase [Chloroflexi bacterium]|nr:dihydropteroate synthase [Chloroflexota bacterium]